YTTIPGSAFDVDWGAGYDLILIPNFLHHFDREGCVGILGRARRALAPGGAVLVVEMVPNDDRVSPPFPAMFAFVMLASTPKGDAWTARESEEMGQAAGFDSSSLKALPPSPQTRIVYHCLRRRAAGGNRDPTRFKLQAAPDEQKVSPTQATAPQHSMVRAPRSRRPRASLVDEEPGHTARPVRRPAGDRHLQHMVAGDAMQRAF